MGPQHQRVDSFKSIIFGSVLWYSIDVGNEIIKKYFHVFFMQYSNLYLTNKFLVPVK